MKGAEALVRSKNKAAVTSLREIALGRVKFNRPTSEAVNEYIKQTKLTQG
jgi:DNA-directed RNA polymerase subunit omega